MVMEAPPSPQSVGREFVRQYYTLLNKAPTHLHRFYNNQSSFVHGGLDPPNRETNPMIGQKQIHQKIQQLNFRDCHAKITQVDSQATLGNGVVVQVTGELSNAGQPMRRFTQTFVLAAQSPKKYYVHNDIFRYQDEIVSDEECEPESRPELDDDVGQDHAIVGEVPLTQQPLPYYNPAAAPIPTNLPPVPPHHGQPPAPPTHVLPPQNVPTVNGAVHPDELNVISGQIPPSHVSTGQGQVMGTPLALQPGPALPPPVAPPMPIDDIQEIIDEVSLDMAQENDFIVNETDLDSQEAPSDTTSNEPKTYATLLKSGGAGGYMINALNFNASQPPKSLSPPLGQIRYDNRDMQPGINQGQNQMNSSGQRNNMNRGPRGNQQRPPRQDMRSSLGKNSISEDGGINYEERRKSGNSFGDSHQLFLGNLPHSATEDDLREIFARFGGIVDLRIHSKPNNKNGPPGPRAPPNYGFITYENQTAVQNCLAAKPIFYPSNDKNGTLLNVEEKKTKDRPSYGGGGGGGRMGNDNRGRDNGPRRGPGGPGVPRGNGPMGGGPGGGGGGRPNSFNRGGPPNRGSNNTYNNRR